MRLLQVRVVENAWEDLGHKRTSVLLRINFNSDYDFVYRQDVVMPLWFQQTSDFKERQNS